MLEKSLSFISNYLNQEIKKYYQLSEDGVVLGNLINPDGSSTVNCENKIIISLLNVEQGKKPESALLSMHVLVSANYSNYLEALKMLSSVMRIVGPVNSISRSNFPDMDSSIDKLDFETCDVSIKEMGKIWNAIGAKYVPSVIYKVRIIAA